MDENQIRQIIKQEIRQAQGQGAFNINQVPLHTHTGTGADAPKIPSSSVIPGLKASGRITMITNDRTYRIGTSFNASSIQFYGLALHSTVTP